MFILVQLVDLLLQLIEDTGESGVQLSPTSQAAAPVPMNTPTGQTDRLGKAIQILMQGQYNVFVISGLVS